MYIKIDITTEVFIYFFVKTISLLTWFYLHAYMVVIVPFVYI